LRLDLAQYRELAAFAQFRSDRTKRHKRNWLAPTSDGNLETPQYQPMDRREQVLIIWSAINGLPMTLR